MLETLVSKALATTKKWWKWILGGIVVLVVFLVIWRMKRQKAEITRLRAEKATFEEKAKDLKLQAQNEKNAAIAQAFREEAEHALEQAKIRDAQLVGMEADYKKQQEAVDKAQNWKELDAQARGGGK